MREILFRGKRLNDGEWVYGVPLKRGNGDTIIAECFSACDEYLCYSAEVDFRYDPFVDPDTVGQYTGLTDKNGKKIFEGDILDCGDRVVYVKWHEGCASWDSQFARYKGHRCSNGVDNAEWQFRAEVIGNIHDNRKLLEAED